MTADRTTISITKACALVDVSRRTIYNWMASGKVEYVRTATGSVRIFVDNHGQTPRPIRMVGEPKGALRDHSEVVVGSGVFTDSSFCGSLRECLVDEECP